MGNGKDGNREDGKNGKGGRTEAEWKTGKEGKRDKNKAKTVAKALHGQRFPMPPY